MPRAITETASPTAVALDCLSEGLIAAGKDLSLTMQIKYQEEPNKAKKRSGKDIEYHTALDAFVFDATGGQKIVPRESVHELTVGPSEEVADLLNSEE